MTASTQETGKLWAGWLSGGWRGARRPHHGGAPLLSGVWEDATLDEMTKAEADRECARRNTEVTPDQPGVHWLVRESEPGDWRAVRVVIPGARPRNPLKTSTESQPEKQPEVRPLVDRNWGMPF